MIEKLWHTMPTDEVIKSLDTDINTGLRYAKVIRSGEVSSIPSRDIVLIEAGGYVPAAWAAH
jgi:hypothetical protein